MHRRRRRGRGSVDDQRSRRAHAAAAPVAASSTLADRNGAANDVANVADSVADSRVRRRLVFSPVVASHAAERERDGAEFRLRGSRACISILLTASHPSSVAAFPAPLAASRTRLLTVPTDARTPTDSAPVALGTHVATPRGGGRGARGGVRGGDGDGGGCGARAKFLGGGDERLPPPAGVYAVDAGVATLRAAPAAHHRKGTLGSDASGRGRCASRAVSVSRRGHPRRQLARGGGVLVVLLGDGVWNGAGRAPTGLLIMRRTYCARTASRARAAAPMTASLRTLAWSARRCAARFSRTCSGVSPDGERGATHGTRAEIRLAASDEATPVEDVPALGGEELALHVLDVGIAPTLAVEGAVAHGTQRRGRAP